MPFNFAGALRENFAPAKLNKWIRLDKSISVSARALRKIRASPCHNTIQNPFLPQSRRATRIFRAGYVMRVFVIFKPFKK